ncbi:serine/arginine repetitive matrix protein 4-like [Eleutherodactylus coqui]|uniref:serine/arginine repetitive matrix protein 4-like n=1 Tax=Eleutherodactylus coqui TaxID=57060 RepID=UPI003461F4DB
MEDLQRQIRQAIQLDGAEWLQDFIVGCRSESESGRPAEEPARKTGAAEEAAQEGDAGRGRPKRRKNPPARLSPSPAAKRGGQKSGRGAEKRSGAGRTATNLAPNSNRAAGRAPAEEARASPAGSPPAKRGQAAALRARSGAKDQRATGRTEAEPARREEPRRRLEARGGARQRHGLQQDGGAGEEHAQVGSAGPGNRARARRGEAGRRGSQQTHTRGGERGRERNSPAVSSVSSTDSRRGGRQSSGDRATSARGSSSPLSGSSSERPLTSHYPDQAPIRGQGTRSRQPPPPSRAYRHDTSEHYVRGARSRSPAQQHLYAPPAPRRLCYVNPRFVGPPSSGGGESSYSYASRASNNRQGKGAKQRQREKARRERYQRKRDREHARLAAEADREPRSASVGNVGDNASGTEHRHQKESYRHATASTTAAAYKDYLRHGRRDFSEERPERGHLGAEHERRALEAPQTSTRQQSPSWGRSPGGRPVRTTTLAEPEDGQAEKWKACIVGHSYVYWAQRRAAVRPLGSDLGLPGTPVTWHGVRGLRWPDMLKLITDISRSNPRRVILVIHAGGNDLGKMKTRDLLAIMKQDILRFRSCFQEVIIVWSDIVARRYWRGARNVEAIEKVRKLVNMKMSQFVQSIGGVAVRHWELEGKERGSLREDGVHLNDLGLDTFLSGLQDGVEAALARVGGVGRNEPQ